MTSWFDQRCAFGCAAIVAALATTNSSAQDPVIGPAVRVDNLVNTDSANETTVGATDANPLEAVAGWNDYRSDGTIRTGFSLSFDRGQTWSSFLLRPPTGFQTSVEGDPMTAFDPRTGTLWAGGIAFLGGGLYVAKKDPGVHTFEPATMADTGNGIDKGWMAAGARLGQPDTTRLFCAYNLGTIWSDDMGATWTDPVAIGSGLGFLPRVGPGGEIYIAYWNNGAGVMLRRSLDDGTSFTEHTIATRMDVWGSQDGSRFPGEFRVPPLSYLDVDESTGQLYACYFDTTNIVEGQRNVDVYFTTSTDQGTTWSTPFVIHGDSDPPGDQFWPWLEVDGAGRIHVVFLDSRHTVQEDDVTDGMFDAYYAWSLDGGATFAEQRLTDSSWNCADDNILGSSQFIGDYLGLAAADNRAYPVYLDTSAGRTELYTRVIEHPSQKTVETESFNIEFGRLLSGGIDDMIDSDDQRLIVEQRPPPSVLLPSIRIEVEGTSTVQSGNALTLHLEASCSAIPATAPQVIDLFNFERGQWETVVTILATSTDSVVDATVHTSVAEYIEDGTRRIRARVAWFEPANIAFPAWSAKIDQAVWVVRP